MWTLLLPLIQKVLPYLLGALLLLFAWRHVDKWLYNHYNENGGVIRTQTETIAEIVSSTQIKVRLGLKRTRNLLVYGVEIDPAQEQQAKDENSKYIAVGDSIRVEEIGGRRIGGGDLSGIVLAPNGTNLALNLLRLGLAKNTAPERKDFVSAEQEAKNSGAGIWHTEKPVKPHRIPWFNDEEENGI